eukprot:731858-Pyramimonas_sp.AAC.1
MAIVSGSTSSGSSWTYRCSAMAIWSRIHSYLSDWQLYQRSAVSLGGASPRLGAADSLRRLQQSTATRQFWFGEERLGSFASRIT